MKHIFTAMGQYLAAALFVTAIFGAHGCSDSGTVNPVVELVSLTVTPGTLQPVFSGGTTQYNVDLTSDVTSVRVAAQAAVAGDTVTINGQTVTSRTITLGLEGSTTPVSIVVSESSNNSRTYIVLLKKANLTGNNSLQSLTVSSGTLAPAFDVNTLSYSATVAESVTNVTVTATKSDPAAVMSGDVTAGTGQATGQATIQLDGPGTSKNISIIVTASNGNSKTYTITVHRAAPASDNHLFALSVRPGSLNPTFDSETRNYEVNVGNNIDDVTVTATKSDPAAVMSGDVTAGTGQATGQATIELDRRRTRISITVTAPNGNSGTYTITVNRASNGDNGGNGDD